MQWIWDQAKSEANLRTHGLSFEAAVFVFDDPMSATREDPYPHEQRWRTIGMVGTQVVMVVHTWPDLDTETGEAIGRIVSARKATRREREAYEEGYY
ncbi:MAG: BrnT family toxin [Chloroflexi bacterium]|nr:BrnT family toxin [Chloroflexota bacterium]MCY3939209.1 BrnT family toxin [Chloroflexota bacterium]